MHDTNERLIDMIEIGYLYLYHILCCFVHSYTLIHTYNRTAAETYLLCWWFFLDMLEVRTSLSTVHQPVWMPWPAPQMSSFGNQWNEEPSYLLELLEETVLYAAWAHRRTQLNSQPRKHSMQPWIQVRQELIDWLMSRKSDEVENLTYWATEQTNR